MEDAMTARYWCHVCSQIVNPIVEVEIKCPFCQSGFVEEITSSSTREGRDAADAETDFGSNQALSLWAPILRFRRIEFDDDNDDGVDYGDNEDGESHHGENSELDRELESIIPRRRRSSANILQLLQGIRAGLNENQTPIGSLGDYFIGLGLDLLLQHLAENDPNRYGTPPVKKEACLVCLDDFEIGFEAKQMPCKHRFHSRCILPWLELHSPCSVCRFQLPSDDESKQDRFKGKDDKF
ncbi:hypothetical protein UlMin_011993 [Ulmus minor]